MYIFNVSSSIFLVENQLPKTRSLFLYLIELVRALAGSSSPFDNLRLLELLKGAEHEGTFIAVSWNLLPYLTTDFSLPGIYARTYN